MVKFAPSRLFGYPFLNLLGGFLFGMPEGMFFNEALALAMALFSFLLARRGGKDLRTRFGKGNPRIAYFAGEAIQNGLLWTLRHRLIPLVPFNEFNLGAGLSHVKLFPYLAGSFLGLLPEIAIYTYLGEVLASLLHHPEVSSLLRLGIATLLLLAISFIPFLYRHMEGWGSEQ